MKIKCARCLAPHSHYTVTAPLCHGSLLFRFCGGCFNEGIEAGEIVWIGDKPYGICADHMSEDVA